MADPTRSRVLLELLSGPGYPARLSENLGLTRTNVSNHLACLRGCGIVVATPEGRLTRYEIADPHLTRALVALVDRRSGVAVATLLAAAVATLFGVIHSVHPSGALVLPWQRKTQPASTPAARAGKA